MGRYAPRSPVPGGEYCVIITRSEMKTTKSGNGSYLRLAFSIIDGFYEGHLLWKRLNINNPNRVTVKIARRELSAICHAVGVSHPKDSSDLHDRPLMITVEQELNDRSGKIFNKITQFKRRDSAMTDESLDFTSTEESAGRH